MQALENIRWQVLTGLHLFIGLTALFGSAVLVGWPDGSFVGLNVGVLVRSPFVDFVLPGVLLYTVGIVHLTAAFVVFGREGSAAFVSFVAGVALVIWLIAELAMVNVSMVMTVGYALLAILVLLAGSAQRLHRASPLPEGSALARPFLAGRPWNSTPLKK